MAKHAPSTTPLLRLWSHLSVLCTYPEMALRSLLTVLPLGAVPFLPDLLPSRKGFGFPHREWSCPQSGHKKGDASVGHRGKHLCSAQPNIPRVSTVMCMQQHRATQLSMVAWGPVLHVTGGCPVTCATTGTSCAPPHTLSPPTFLPNSAICLWHGFQPPGWAPERHWGWRAVAGAQCHVAKLGHPTPAWAPQGPWVKVAFPHLCCHLAKPCVHPQAGGGPCHAGRHGHPGPRGCCSPSGLCVGRR